MRTGMTSLSDYSTYFAHKATVRSVHGLVIRYRLALDGPTVIASHSDLDGSLPEYSVRIATGQDELLIHSAQWADRQGELKAHVLAWILRRVNLRGARLRRGSRRYDDVWMNAWREANPDRR